MTLLNDYLDRYDQYLKVISLKIEGILNDDLNDIQNIDRISVRAKDPDRFIKKAAKKELGEAKYSDPLSQIQDQIGARIIVFYLEDVKTVAEEIEGYFRPIENQELIPECESEFGYIGKHYVLKIPEDAIDDNADRSKIPNFFELQIKTLFQHAWSEANHDLGYKSDQGLSSHQKRKLAFTAAQAWGADQIFAELQKELA